MCIGIVFEQINLCICIRFIASFSLREGNGQRALHAFFVVVVFTVEEPEEEDLVDEDEWKVWWGWSRMWF